MKNIFFIFGLTFCFLIQIARADLAGDAEIIFDWAEETYPHFFPLQKSTQTLDTWLYRYYPETGIYAGVNTADGGVYVLGGEFGPDIRYIAPYQDILNQVNQTDSNSSCVTVPNPVVGTRVFSEVTTHVNGVNMGVTATREDLIKDYTDTRSEVLTVFSTINSGIQSSYSTNTVTNGFIENDIRYGSSIEITRG